MSKTKAKSIEYYPPKTKHIQVYVNLVCREMQKRHGDKYIKNEFVGEFTSFLKIIADIKAKQLNQVTSTDLRE